jgi:hypothetical protein
MGRGGTNGHSLSSSVAVVVPRDFVKNSLGGAVLRLNGQESAVSDQRSAFGSRQSAIRILFVGVVALLAVALTACGGGPVGVGSSSNGTSSNTGTPGSNSGGGSTPQGGSGTVPHSGHVVLIIEENHTFNEVMASMPWLTAQGSQYAFANNYFADEPGSLLDYLWLSSGSGEQQFGCTGAACASPITHDSIFSELTRNGLTWKVYAQGLPSIGWMGGDSGAYTARHNPAKWYSDVINDPSMQKNIVPFGQLALDIATGHLPNYSLIIPDVNNDAHNGTLGQADGFLQSSVAPLLMNHPAFQAGGDGLMIVTFDECDGAVGACPQHIYTAVIGPNVKPGFQSDVKYRHENTLRTLLEALGVHTFPGASNTAAPMADFFK